MMTTDLFRSDLDEEWKPIPGYEGLYDASNFGRVRSTPGKVTSSAKADRRVWQSRIMKPKYQRSKKRQDARLSLWKDGEVKDHLVSRLVASAWIGEPQEDMTVNHIDGDYNNNSADNLEWVTLRENIQKGYAEGCYDSVMQPVMLTSPNGEKYFFRNMSEAGLWLGRTKGYISACLIRNSMKATDKNGNSYIITAL